MRRRWSRSAKIAACIAAVGSVATWVGACNALLDAGSFTFGSCDNAGDRRCVDNALQQCSANGTWTGAAPPCHESACSADAGVCVGVCDPGAMRCSPEGSSVQACDNTGQWHVRTPCPHACSNAECTPCTPGQTSCEFLDAAMPDAGPQGNTQLICSAMGSWMPNMTACDPPACLHGTCVPCLPGQTRCQGTYQQACDDTGQWQSPAPCKQPGFTCQSDQGKCGMPCTAGELQCLGDSGIIQSCDAGQWESVGACTDPCVPCTNGACAQADAGTPCTPPCFTSGFCGAAGGCVGVDPVECVDASDSLCNAPICDPTTGRCSAADGTKCNGGDTCSPNDTCSDGVCSDTPGPDPAWAHWSFAGVPPTPPYIATNQVVYDRGTHLMWQLAPFGAALSHEDAETYCECLDDTPPSGGCSTGGFTAKDVEPIAGYPSGWRLPTRIELMSIVQYDEAASKSPPLLDSSFKLSQAAGDTFWTSSIVYEAVDAKMNAYAYAVSFHDGTVTSTGLANALAVRCVRSVGGASSGKQCSKKFEAVVYKKGTATVHAMQDVETGLVWQTGNSFTSDSRSGAESACFSVGFGFRLPTVLELATTIDDATGTFAGGLTGKQPATYWTATATSGTNAYAIVTNGVVGIMAESKKNVFRCVK